MDQVEGIRSAYYVDGKSIRQIAREGQHHHRQRLRDLLLVIWGATMAKVMWDAQDRLYCRQTFHSWPSGKSVKSNPQHKNPRSPRFRRMSSLNLTYVSSIGRAHGNRDLPG